MDLMQHKYNGCHIKNESFSTINFMYLATLQCCIIKQFTLWVLKGYPKIMWQQKWYKCTGTNALPVTNHPCKNTQGMENYVNGVLIM